MSRVKQLLDSLLWDIYGQQQKQLSSQGLSQSLLSARQSGRTLHGVYESSQLQYLGMRKLIDIGAILKVELRLMGHILERSLIRRDRLQRHQEVLCSFVDAILYVEYLCILHGYYHSQPKMRFSLSPPPPKAVATSPTSNMQRNGNANAANNNNIAHNTRSRNSSTSPQPHSNTGPTPAKTVDDEEAASDYNQWLHAMKLVARLPGGMPPEFRRKLWLSLADKYLKSKKIDWSLEEDKCFCEKWREDDEELGIQIVKDLHRTGSNLCTGPAGSINQAKLKRILLGYARYNPEVGYCQGFNMLGALILQVMDKEESESMKVMIYLVEGVLPSGYFCGSMGGLQADMGVFRELMQTKLPRLAKHLQKLQGPIENAFEPPLTNVFTMQWFLTLFCTCLPMTCVLRVWDLILIEGSDVLLRTALVLWSLLEERVLKARTADDFYCKMGSFSSELLNGHLIDSNGLIEKVVDLGSIPDLQKLRDKHLYNIAPLRHKQGLQLYFDDEEPESDEESRLAVATVWGLSWGRRGSQTSTTTKPAVATENKERIALDISLLKKQYDRLRERQKQAHIILTTAVSTTTTTRQSNNTNPTLPINQLLLGRSPIINSKGRRPAPPGSIPPARKPSLPTILHSAKPAEKQLRRGETLHWRDTDLSKRRRDSMTWKEIKADRASIVHDSTDDVTTVRPQSNKLRTRMGKSDSSSYSEESEDNDDDGSSTDTSLCDDDDPVVAAADKTHGSSLENSPKRRSKATRKQKDLNAKLQRLTEPSNSSQERTRPKSWAPSSNEIPFTLMTGGSDSPSHSGDENTPHRHQQCEVVLREEEDSATESECVALKRKKQLDWQASSYSPIAGDLATTKLIPLHIHTDALELPAITSTSQLSPMPDIATYLNSSTISPLPTPKLLFLDSTNSLGSGDGDDAKKFDVSDDGVTNQYFERVNSVERPTKLLLIYSLNEDNATRSAYKPVDSIPSDRQRSVEHDVTVSAAVVKGDASDAVLSSSESDAQSRRLELLMDYSEKSSAAYIAEATNEISSNIKKDKTEGISSEEISSRDNNIPGENRDDYVELRRKPLSKEQCLLNASRKRRDPRRLTMTRSSTIDIEERYQALEKRLSIEMATTDRSNFQECETPKRPLSMANLEERSHMIEKQLSFSKRSDKRDADTVESATQRRIDNYRCDKTESFDSGVPISDMSDSESICYRKPKRERIPSTADLENRFDALERQMSSHSLKSKTPGDFGKGNDKEEETRKGNEQKPVRERGGEDVQEEQLKTNTKNDCQEQSGEEPKDAGKPRLVKLPSTAELEDRFNALEKRKSVQKESPSKRKKEPPDEATPSKEKNGPNANDTRDAPNPEIEEKRSKPAKKKSPVQENNEALEEKPITAKPDEPQKKSSNSESDVKQPTPKPENQATAITPKEEDATKIKKKSPPSTEELEKRFQALEKQKSCASLETPSDNIKKQDDAANKKNRDDKETDDAVKAPAKQEVSKKQSNVDEPKTESMKAFDEKLKDVNEKLATDDAKQKSPKIPPERQLEQDETKKTIVDEEKHRQASKCTDGKCEKNIKQETETLPEATKKGTQPAEDTAKVPITTNSTMSKRRASEPPTTEDLEKRYETLKRRMSSTSKAPKEERRLSRAETVEEALERIEKEVMEEAVEVNTKHDEPAPADDRATKKKGEPPTTAELESRFEALQEKSSRSAVQADDTKVKVAVEKEVKPSTERKETMETEKQKPVTTKEPAASTKETTEVTDMKIQAQSKVPVAPPMPVAAKTQPDESLNQKDGQRHAFIKELESKIKTQANDENIKPSDINPNRRSPAPNATIGNAEAARFDATSETHAAHAFYGSENYELWQTQTNKMIRRFSDLPSRCDLENRLQFLERQLYKKLNKQRRASDSEVTSREQVMRSLAAAKGKGNANTQSREPNTVQQPQLNDSPSSDLEKRVQALEKQLSENSLKLLEAMRAQESVAAGGLADGTETPRRLSTETIDATGKELVKYTHYRDLDDTENHKPINISINIKMLMNKEGVDDRKQKEEDGSDLPSTEELEKRLEMLEHQLKLAHTRDAEASNAHAEEQPVDDLHIPEVKAETRPESANAVQVEKSDELENQQVEIKANVDNAENELPASSDPVKQECEVTETKHLEEASSQVTIEKTDNPKDEEHKVSESAVEPKSATQPEQPEPEAIVNDDIKVLNAEQLPANTVLNAQNTGGVESNNKTMVLLLDNEPKAVKVRRLTRANTEELEGLFQALEKQLSERNLVKSDDGKLRRAPQPTQADSGKPSEESQAIFDLTKEIEEFTSGDKPSVGKAEQKPGEKPVEKDKAYDWGPDPVKRHLKRKTVYLPSTKELEARFRSLERQIKLLEDVEKIDVEYRLSEIERKIKLQYSLSHEKDLNRYLELCEGKGLDDDVVAEAPTTTTVKQVESPRKSAAAARPRTPTISNKEKTPHTSPNRCRENERRSPYTSPSRTSHRSRSPYTSPSRTSHRSRSPYTSPSRTSHRSRSPYQSPKRQPSSGELSDDIPTTEALEYRYHALDLKRSKSRESLDAKSPSRRKPEKQPIHPLEMLLDPSPEEIPSTGELEHRMRVLSERRYTPSPPLRHNSRSRSHSPTIEDIKRRKQLHEKQYPRAPVHNLERLVSSPTKREPPTTVELEARMLALEQDHTFDMKTQKNFKEFNQRLRNVISPSRSFEEFRAPISREVSPKRVATTPKSSLSDRSMGGAISRRDDTSMNPKVIRFQEETDHYDDYRSSKSRPYSRDNERTVGNPDSVLQIIEENSKILHRILQKTIADSHSSFRGATATATPVAVAAAEGLEALTKLMRETSPLRRTGTHTGVPLRTNDNINERLTSIKNTIKSIDTLCEEKPYRKEKCQRYIDSLFSDSVHFKAKASLEDLSRRSEHTPAIRISDHSQRPSDPYYYLSRSIGSAESIRSISPLSARSSNLQHHRSNRELRREVSPRGRRARDEDREEYESRVRRAKQLPNYLNDNSSYVSSDSLIKFHKVDSQLDTYDCALSRSRSHSASRSPSMSPFGSDRELRMFLLSDPPRPNMSAAGHHNNNTHNTIDSASIPTTTTTIINSKRLDWDRPVSPYRQQSHNLRIGGYEPPKRPITPVYSPAKLEIRHTTVTSTFYDRLLAERQIERTLSRQSSRSPLISPSITSRSYADLATQLAQPDNTAAFKNATNSSTALSGSYLTGSISPRAVTMPVFTSNYSATTPTGNSSMHHHHNQTALHTGLTLGAVDASDLRIRSCDNILNQLKSTTYTSPPSTTTAALAGVPPSFAPTTAIATTSTATSLPPYMLTSSSFITTTTTSNNTTTFGIPTTTTTTTTVSSPTTDLSASSTITTTTTATKSLLTGIYGTSSSSSFSQSPYSQPSSVISYSNTAINPYNRPFSYTAAITIASTNTNTITNFSQSPANISPYANTLINNNQNNNNSNL